MAPALLFVMPPAVVARAGAGLGGFLLLLILIGLYFLPTIVAFYRKVPNSGSVFVINLFLGWTFIAWVVALAMAVRSRPTQLP